VAEERHLVQSAAGKRATDKIVPLLAEKTIMRVDRIDPAKNILNGFHGYAEMLEQHPELCGKVVFLAFLLPTRLTIPVYKRYREDVITTIDWVRLNGNPSVRSLTMIGLAHYPLCSIMMYCLLIQLLMASI
jgi:trehalose-6-phosphate synthase